MKCCAKCGQPLLTRYGVELPRRKAELFDYIERTGKRGISRAALADIFYPRTHPEAAKLSISSHIHQINDLLVSTDTRIRMDERSGFYHVVEEAA